MRIAESSDTDGNTPGRLRGIPRLAAALVTAAALAACDAPPNPPAHPADSGAGPSAPAAPTKGAAAKSVAELPQFVDVAKEAGLVVANHTGMPDQKDWIASGIGGGAIVLDYDQDGRMDLVVVDGTMLTEKGDLEYDDAWRTRVWHNDGGMHFTDVTAKSGVDLKGFGVGGASCDYDGDGRPDFYVCGWGCNRLFHNRGDGTFEDVTEKAGVRGAPDDFSTACCWGDVNGDGVPDLYVANYVDQRAFIEKCRRENAPPRSARYRGAPVYVGPWGLEGQKDRLYFGVGDGTFREVTDSNLGPQSQPRFGFQPVMTDVDGDGDLDIYVANDNGPNYLWINDGGGKFVDRAVEAGAAATSKSPKNEFIDEPVSTPLRSELARDEVTKAYGARVKTFGIARHPAQLYESISCVFLFLFLFWLWSKKKENTPTGRIFGWFMVILWSLRFSYEFLKENQEAFENNLTLNMGQILSIPLFIVGVWVLVRSYKKDSIENKEAIDSGKV